MAGTTDEAATPADPDAPTATATATADSAANFVATISCPNGATIELVASAASCNPGSSNGTSFVILGRGRCGIPASAVHVSTSAASVRIVDMNNCSSEDNSSTCFGLELAVVGSQPCRVNRRPIYHPPERRGYHRAIPSCRRGRCG